MSIAEDIRADADLVQQALAGDTAAFEELVGRHFETVFMVAYARVGNRESAEDIAQEVVLRAYLNLRQLQEPARFSAWVCRIARNLAMDWHRRPESATRLIPRLPAAVDVDQLPDRRREGVRDKMEREEQERAVRAAVLRLPPDMREIVLLHYCEDLNPREIGDRLGLHRTTVRYRLGRAVKAFRVALEPLVREVAPGALQPSASAGRRACGVIVAAAALGVAEKQALAAAGLGAAHAASASLGVGSALSFTGLVQSVMALAGAGGAIMGVKTTVAAGCVAVALAGGGTYWYVSSGSGGGGGAAGTAPTASEIVFLKQLTAEEGKMAIDGARILTPGLGSAERIDNMNAVLVRDVREKLPSAKQFLEQIDRQTTPASGTSTAEVRSKLFKLKHISAEEACKAVQGILTPNVGTAGPVSENGVMVGVAVTDVPSKLELVLRLLAQIDVKASPPSGSAQARTMMRQFALRSVAAGEANKAIQGALTPNVGSSTIRPETNELIVVDVLAAIRKVEDIVNRMDGGGQAGPPADAGAAVRTCQENLAKLDGAKEQYALEFRLPAKAPVTMQNLLTPGGSQPGQGYLKREPVCPAGGIYTPNALGTNPTCSLGAAQGHVLP